MRNVPGKTHEACGHFGQKVTLAVLHAESMDSWTAAGRFTQTLDTKNPVTQLDLQGVLQTAVLTAPLLRQLGTGPTEGPPGQWRCRSVRTLLVVRPGAPFVAS